MHAALTHATQLPPEYRHGEKLFVLTRDICAPFSRAFDVLPNELDPEGQMARSVQAAMWPVAVYLDHITEMWGALFSAYLGIRHAIISPEQDALKSSLADLTAHHRSVIKHLDEVISSGPTLVDSLFDLEREIVAFFSDPPGIRSRINRYRQELVGSTLLESRKDRALAELPPLLASARRNLQAATSDAIQFRIDIERAVQRFSPHHLAEIRHQPPPVRQRVGAMVAKIAIIFSKYKWTTMPARLTLYSASGKEHLWSR